MADCGLRLVWLLQPVGVGMVVLLLRELSGYKAGLWQLPFLVCDLLVDDHAWSWSLFDIAHLYSLLLLLCGVRGCVQVL